MFRAGQGELRSFIFGT